MVRLGQAGEAAVRKVAEIGDKIPIFVNGRDRIPDGLTSSVLTEVKNVAYQGWTRQLKDYATHAQQQGLRFELWLRDGATPSKQLLQAVDDRLVNLRVIP